MISTFNTGSVPEVHCTVGQINQKPRQKYWATRSSICLFACTTHSFACSALLALLTCSVALTCSLAHSLALGTVNNSMAIYSVFFLFWPIVRWRFDSDGHIWLLTAASCFGPLYSASEGSVLRHTAVIAFGSPLKASKKSILHCAMHNLH